MDLDKALDIMCSEKEVEISDKLNERARMMGVWVACGEKEVCLLLPKLGYRRTCYLQQCYT